LKRHNGKEHSVLGFLAYSNKRIIFFPGYVDLRVQRVKDIEKQLQVEQDEQIGTA